MVSDTGATTHMTGNAGKLDNIRPYKGLEGVMVGNGQILDITHVGDSHANCGSTSLPLKNVLLVPNMKKDLLSVSQLTHDLPFVFEFDANGFFIRERGTKRLIASGKRKGGLYSLESGHAALFSTRFRKTNKEGWHQRLGHPQYRVVDFLFRRKLINFHPTTDVEKICDSCQMGKASL